jgi:2-methylfumaryl-CoA isomerase
MMGVTQSLLDGLRVVEVSAFVAAPISGMTLAQLGAEVIRIDPIGGGADIRRTPLAPDGTSLYWAGLNKGKRSVALDLKSAEGRELATALSTKTGAGAGILVTNLPPVGWLDYETLRTRRNDLIMLVLSGHADGSTAVDYTVNAAVGLPQLTGGEEERGVVNHVLPAWDIIAGLHLAVGLLAAERHRSRCGVGQRVDIALSDVAYAAMSALGFIAEAQLGIERPRIGNDIYGAYGRDFVTADRRRLMVVGITPRQWRSIVNATSAQAPLAALAQRLGLDLSLEEARYAARKEISEILGAWFSAHSAEEARSALDAESACWSFYRSVSDMVRNDPGCSLANAMFSEVEQSGIDAMLSAASPLRHSHPDRRPAEPAPRLGQDTAAILMRDLGLSERELEELSGRGTIPPLSGMPR